MARSPFDRLPAVVRDAVALNLDGRSSKIEKQEADLYLNPQRVR
jgi:hypothetical protein